jgi:hypothetical protein
MKNENRHGSNIAFIDLLFNILLVFVALFIVLLTVIKSENTVQQAAVEDKNEFVITVTWDDGTEDDVDVWVQGPTQNIVSFRSKQAEGMYLQRDDTGKASDSFYGPNGEYITSPLNQEIVNIRKIIPGRYVVNLHMFAKRDPNKATVKLKIIKVNPYSESATTSIEMAVNGEEVTAFIFEVAQDGSILMLPTVPTPFIMSSAFSGGGSYGAYDYSYAPPPSSPPPHRPENGVY